MVGEAGEAGEAEVGTTRKTSWNPIWGTSSVQLEVGLWKETLQLRIAFTGRNQELPSRRSDHGMSWNGMAWFHATNHELVLARHPLLRSKEKKTQTVLSRGSSFQKEIFDDFLLHCTNLQLGRPTRDRSRPQEVRSPNSWGAGGPVPSPIQIPWFPLLKTGISQSSSPTFAAWKLLHIKTPKPTIFTTLFDSCARR